MVLTTAGRRWCLNLAVACRGMPLLDPWRALQVCMGSQVGAWVQLPTRVTAVLGEEVPLAVELPV